MLLSKVEGERGDGAVIHSAGMRLQSSPSHSMARETLQLRFQRREEHIEALRDELCRESLSAHMMGDGQEIDRIRRRAPLQRVPPG